MERKMEERGAYRVRGVRGLDPRAVKEEAHRVEGLALTLAEGGHELLELGAALDLEEDLVVVVGDLDVEVLCVGGRDVVLGGLVVVFGHCFCSALRVCDFVGFERAVGLEEKVGVYGLRALV
jgi:hypothetical protein